VAFETNPLVQARSSLSSQSTYLTGLVAAFHVVSDAAVDDSESLRGERRAAVLAVSDRVESNLRAMTAALQGADDAVVPSLADLIATDALMVPNVRSTEHATIVDAAAPRR
jgi:hypothetical protein